MEKMRCAAEFWMDFTRVMDEQRKAAKELLSEDHSKSYNLGSQQIKTPVDFEMIEQMTTKDNSGDKISLITGNKLQH